MDEPITTRTVLHKTASWLGGVIGGPPGALIGAIVSAVTKPNGVKDSVGEVVAKSPLKSTTIWGGISLAALIPLWNVFSDLVATAIPWEQPAAIVKLVVVVYLLGVVIRGRMNANVPVAKARQ